MNYVYSNLRISHFGTSEIRKAFLDQEWHYYIDDVTKALIDCEFPKSFISKHKRDSKEFRQLWQLSNRIMPYCGNDDDCTKCAAPQLLSRIIKTMPSARNHEMLAWLESDAKEPMVNLNDIDTTFDLGQINWVLDHSGGVVSRSIVNTTLVDKQLNGQHKSTSTMLNLWGPLYPEPMAENDIESKGIQNPEENNITSDSPKWGSRRVQAAGLYKSAPEGRQLSLWPETRTDRPSQNA